MTECITCGAEITDQKFCPECGTAVAAARTVPPGTVGDVDELADAAGPADAAGGADAAAPVDASASAAAALVDASASAAPAPSAVVRLFRSLTSERWLAVGAATAVAYVASLVVAMAVTLLALLAQTGSTVNWSWLFLMPAQLVALALGGTFSAETSVLGLSLSVSVLWVPLLLTAVVIAGITVISRWDERKHPSPSRAVRWLLSIASGLTLTILALVLSAVLRPSFSSADAVASNFGAAGQYTVTGSAASISLFFGALVIGTISAAVARSRVARQTGKATTGEAPTDESTKTGGAFTSAVSAAAPVGLLYLGTVATLLALTFIVTGGIRGGLTALLTLPLWLPTLVADGIAVLNFSVVAIAGPLASFPGVGTANTQVSLIGTLPLWVAIIACLVNLALIVSAGVIVRLRRVVNAPASAANWISTIGVFLLGGVAVSVLGSIALWSHATASALGGDSVASTIGSLSNAVGAGLMNTSGTVGPAGWTFIVFAIVGAAVETSALFVAPLILRVLPDGAHRRAAKLLGRVGVPIAAPGQGVDSQQTKTPLEPALRRRVVLISSISGGLILLVLVGAIAASVLNATVFGPQRQVEGFLSSIQHKDAAGALAIGEIDAPNSSRGLLTKQVLSATPSGVTGYRIVGTRVYGDTASVTAEIDQDGAKTRTSFSLQRDGSSWLVLDSWRLNTIALHKLLVEVPKGAQTLEVNGVTISVSGLSNEEGYVQLPVFPGQYTVALGKGNTWLTARPQKATVTMDDGADPESTVRLTLIPTEAMKKEVSAQISGWLTTCSQSTEFEPKGCPFSYYSFGTSSGVSWKLGDAPTFDIKVYSDGGWRIVTKARGSATINYTYKGYSGDSAETGTDSFYVDGTVDFAKGKPVYSYGG